MTEAEEITGGEPTSEQTELFEWIEKGHERALANVRDALQRLVTLTTALLAGSAALIAHVSLPWWSKTAGPLLLLLSLAAALLGSLPRWESVPRGYVDRARELREQILSRKADFLLTASILLLLAFLVMIVGLLTASPAAHP
jgi:hypothetical protein